MSVARLSSPVAWRLDGRGGVFSSTLIIDKTRLQQVKTSVATSHTHCGVDHLTDNAPALIGGKCGINPSEEKEYHDYERWRHPHMAIAKDTTMKEGWHGKNKKTGAALEVGLVAPKPVRTEAIGAGTTEIGPTIAGRTGAAPNQFAGRLV